MKSVYLDNQLHAQLKTLSAHEKKSLSDLIAGFLQAQLKKHLSDLPTSELQKLSENGGSFDFLNDPREDIYSETDGESLS